MIAATFPESVLGDEQSRAKQLAEAREALKQLDPTTAVEPLAEALRKAMTSGPVTEKAEALAQALETAGMSDTPRPPKKTIRQALASVGLSTVLDKDVDAVCEALRERALRMNRLRYEARTDPNLQHKIAAAEGRVAQLQLPATMVTAASEAGIPQRVTASVVEPGLRELLGPTMDLNFDLPSWKPAQFTGPKVTVYLRGEYRTSAGLREGPLLVTFPAEKGTVIFTSFHNEAQNSKQEETLLRYLVFTAVTAKEESLVAKTMLQGGSASQKSLLSHSSGNPTITQTYRCSQPGRLQWAGISGTGGTPAVYHRGPQWARIQKGNRSNAHRRDSGRDCRRVALHGDRPGSPF